MSESREFSPEVCERAVCMVLEHRGSTHRYGLRPSRSHRRSTACRIPCTNGCVGMRCGAQRRSETSPHGQEEPGDGTRMQVQGLTCQPQNNTASLDIQDNCMRVVAHVVVDSLGGYRFRKTRAQIQPATRKVLKPTPIDGEFQGEQTEIGLVSSTPTFLKELALRSRCPGLRMERRLRSTEKTRRRSF
jgi:hypothetical protein